MTATAQNALENGVASAEVAELTPPAREIRRVRVADPLARPLLADLEREYDARYGVEVFGEPASAELARYPEAAFEPPSGAFLLLLEHGADEAAPLAISGGALMRYDADTAELKRVWTRLDRRGEGLAALILTALEDEALRLGYTRVYLTTGPRQPEAVALYLRNGYTPLYDTGLSAAEIGVHPFERRLVPIAGAAPGETTSAKDNRS